MIAKITAGGKVPLRAAVRKRWAVRQVVIEDDGDRLTVRPLPDDAIAAACGSLKRRGPAAEVVGAHERRAAREAELRRLAR